MVWYKIFNRKDIDFKRVTANQRRWAKGVTLWHRGYIEVCLSEYPENYVKLPLTKGRWPPFITSSNTTESKSVLATFSRSNFGQDKESPYELREMEKRGWIRVDPCFMSLAETHTTVISIWLELRDSTAFMRRSWPRRGYIAKTICSNSGTGTGRL